MNKKDMIPLTDMKISLMKSKKFVTYVRKHLVLIKMTKMHLNYTIKSEIIAITLKNLEELLIVFAFWDTKHIPVVFHNGPTYDYHFIIEELAKEFKGQFKCLGEYTESI